MIEDPATFQAALGLAAWLGLLTAISPCPLASNVAALAFIGRNTRGFWRATLAGLAFALGRTVATALLAALLVKGLLSVPGLSVSLERWASALLSPLFVLMGLLMFGLLPFKLPGFNDQGLSERLAARGGLLAAFGLGAVLALAFCPVSAGLFFGNLLPLATAHQSPWLLPAVYGLATGLPVALLGAAVGMGTGAAARAFRVAGKIEAKARIATAWVFILVGAWLSWRYFFP